MKLLRRGALAAALLLLALPTAAAADGSAYPDLDGTISMVRGQPIMLPPLSSNREIDHVRVQVDGRTIQTDDFAPFEDPIETRHRFDHLELELETEHTLTQTAFDWEDQELAAASYPLFIHPLPLIPRVHVFPLVVRKQTRLVGFQLRGTLPGAHVAAWGRGFIGHGRGFAKLPLRLRKSSQTGRTYVVPGGLYWWSNVSPHVIFSIGAPPGASKYRFPLRGRVFTGILRTGRNEDTVIRQTDGWDRCAYELSNRGRPPRRASCTYLF